ncbi:MAG: hypothetical protein SFT90_07750 [Rickettsiales bacterium]|nr:hypothetical protein [Rickettsiales bacterium]
MKFIKLNRSVISISGSDAEKFLQGIISNDIRKANSQDAICTYFLTPQGKYISDFFIIGFNGGYLIDCPEIDKDLLLKKFNIYKLRSAVKIIDLSNDFEVFQIIEATNQQINELANQIIFQDVRSENMGYRLLKNKSKNLEIQSSDIKLYHQLRIDNLVVEGEFDLEKEKSFPLQFRMIENNAVDFKKGCYVGQEVTARTHHRGAIRKTIYKISANENLENITEKEILSDDISVGKILSIVGNNALAQIEIEAVQQNKPLKISGIDVVVNQ